MTLEVCGAMPEIVYKFENQNISTFEGNIRFMGGELPFAIYFDLESTCGKKVYKFDGIAKMYPVSYAFVMAFHLEKLCHNKLQPHLDQLNDISYLSNEILKHFHLSFDTAILFPRDSSSNRRKILKVIYKIRNRDKNDYEDKRTVVKILKRDENNQYGNAMTKPVPTGCIKKSKKISDLRELNLLLEGISGKDKIGHLLIVDIAFDEKRPTEKHYLLNEIYTPIFEEKSYPTH